MKIVVLCGGRGTRLGLGDKPKPMVLVEGVPLLERLVGLAARQGFKEFLFLAGHGSAIIEQHFGSGERWGVSIEHVSEPSPLGSAGCFREVRDKLAAPFLVIYGDVLFDVDLTAFAAFGQAAGGMATLFVHPNDHPEDSDLVEVDETGQIIAFHAKPHLPGSRHANLVNAAIYYMDPRALNYLPAHDPCDWGHDVLPRMSREAAVFAYRSCEYVKDIGTPDRLVRAIRHLREGRVARLSGCNAKPVVFVDRDGVINEERGGVFKPDEVALIPGSAEAIRRLNDAGVPVICVTNQPFIAKGQIDWPGLRAVGAEIDYQLAAAAGAFLDDVRICPHHPESGWEGEVAALKIACACRKPAPGLLLEAARFHNIDLGHSWMVGDRFVDIVAGHGAGARTILVETGAAGSDRGAHAVAPERIAGNLEHAVALIMDDFG